MMKSVVASAFTRAVFKTFAPVIVIPVAYLVYQLGLKILRYYREWASSSNLHQSTYTSKFSYQQQTKTSSTPPEASQQNVTTEIPKPIFTATPSSLCQGPIITPSVDDGAVENMLNRVKENYTPSYQQQTKTPSTPPEASQQNVTTVIPQPIFTATPSSQDPIITPSVDGAVEDMLNRLKEKYTPNVCKEAFKSLYDLGGFPRQQALLWANAVVSTSKYWFVSSPTIQMFSANEVQIMTERLELLTWLCEGRKPQTGETGNMIWPLIIRSQEEMFGMISELWGRIIDGDNELEKTPVLDNNSQELKKITVLFTALDGLVISLFFRLDLRSCPYGKDWFVKRMELVRAIFPEAFNLSLKLFQPAYRDKAPIFEFLASQMTSWNQKELYDHAEWLKTMVGPFQKGTEEDYKELALQLDQLLKRHKASESQFENDPRTRWESLPWYTEFYEYFQDVLER